MKRNTVMFVLFLLLSGLAAESQVVTPISKASSAAPTLSDGKYYPFYSDLKGNLRTVPCDSSGNCSTVTAGAVNTNIRDTLGNTILAATDPCWGVLTTHFTARLTSATVAKIIPKVSAKKNYICDLLVVNVGAAIERVMVIEGTKVTNECDTAPAAILGSDTTVAHGQGLAANAGGFLIDKTIPGLTTNQDTCIGIAGTNETLVDGHYVQQ